MATRARILMSLALGLGILGGGSQSEAAADEPVQILAPRDGARSTSGAVTIRVRTRGTLPRFRAWVDRGALREVSGRFRGSRHGVHTARLRLGRELRPGRNQLYVRVRKRSGRRAVASVRFTVGRERPGWATIGGLPRRVERTPVTLRVRAPGGRTLQARLNGDRLGRAFERSGRGWTARLAAHDGLRFGRNRLDVTVFDARGRYARIQRTFRVGRERPLVGAGRDRVGRAKARLRLDGSATRASRRSARLQLRWRVVAKPRGSRRARLERARSAHPLFVPDVRGVYRIRLRADQVPQRGGAHSAQSASATDTVTVTAQPDVLPKGVPLTTIVDATRPGIQVGGSFYPMGSGWLQMLVLDRATLALSDSVPDPTRTYPGTDQGAALLTDDVGSVTSDDLVVLSGGGTPATFSDVGTEAVLEAISFLGGTVVPNASDVLSAIPSGEWSLVGVPGTPPGSAYQFMGLDFGNGAPAGSMTGFLQLDSSGNFAFTWPQQFQSFDTQAPGTTNAQSQIAVGSQSYASGSTGGLPGFHLLWLDADSLQLRGQFTYANDDCGSGPTCINSFWSQLQLIAADPTPAMLLLATIDQPSVDNGTGLRAGINSFWGSIATELLAFGANPYAFVGLDGTGDYSFVGVDGLGELGPNEGTELSQVIAGTPSARIAGIFQRNRQGLWVPGANGSPRPGDSLDPFQPDLVKILGQPDQGFTPFTSPAQRAAEAYIAASLGYRLDPTYGIRGNYWQNASIWSTAVADLEGVRACTTSPCRAGFQAVFTTLEREFEQVATVRDFFTGSGTATLDGVFNEAFDNSSVGFTATAFDILSLYNPPTTSTATGPNPLDVAIGAISIASGGAGVAAGGLASGPFAIAGGVLTIIQATTAEPDGTPTFDPTRFEQQVGSFGTTLASAWDAQISNLSTVADLLVSDAGRLTAAASEITEGGWGLNTQSEAQLVASLSRSVGQYVWQSLLPVAATAWECDTYPGSQVLGTEVPQSDVVQIVKADSVPDTTHLFLAKSGDFVRQSSIPDSATLALLFGNPANGTGLGLQKPYFMAPALTDSSGNVTSSGFAHENADEALINPGCESNP